MKWAYQEKQLKYMLILLALRDGESDSEIETWMTCIEIAGIRCILETIDNRTGDSDGQIKDLNQKCMPFLTEFQAEDTLILTDIREISHIFSKNGYVCIGLDPLLETFFDGAETVVSSIADLDTVYMEETFRRAKGIPVLVAETERMRIREIVKEDIPALYEMSRQDGMEYAFADLEQAECFECSRMEAYIANVYRFYGYGLWTVETLQGELIGCCGVSDLLNLTEDDQVTDAYIIMYMPDHVQECEECSRDICRELVMVLEMQYFVANRFQKQGYGIEMCRAVVKYAQERLSEYKLCVRVHPENLASVKLAEKLGFRQ